MSSKKQKEIEKSLRRKGFALDIRGDHRFLCYERSMDGKTSTIRTKTSHGAREIGTSLLSQMAKQCKLSLPQFSELVDCQLDRESYENILRTNGQIKA
jgi:predicted RNA binding protein YcfA (HicA-like mRNA interferase family)